MSEPQTISPLLDGFTMGNPMSDHDGVRCCPAIKENSDKKYIVKIISVPASQVQMDALLLAGAYKDPADAMDYFKEVADGVVKEAEFLQKLAKLEGFLPYEGWQIVPITRRRLGYQVYLTGTYKQSLEKYVRRNPVTHLEAVNLGLDLCSALSVCRQAGSMYVDLKPSNVFITEDKGYRIGDLGFVELDSMQYTSLPNKYRSPYSPPELHDPMTTLNDTADTYAVGMILYQLYNDGQLPFRDKAPEEALPSPLNADYEIAEIIMKAIDPDPANRWKDPKELGQALVAYMQRNSVNNVPITPHTPLEIDPEDVILAEDGEKSPEEAEEEPVIDETAPSEDTAEQLHDYEMSEELSKIVEKADDLISHETPEGVVIPEPEELPEPDPFAFAAEEEVLDEEIPDPFPQEPEAPAEEEAPPKKKKAKSFVSPEHKRKVRSAISALIVLLVLAVIACGAFWYYQNFYLQTIDSITIDADQNQLVVTVDTAADQSLLRVTCTDTYGNTDTKSVENGKAVFTDLVPGTMYKIQLEIDGFHKLVGQTSDIYTTDSITGIVSFSAVTGPEDGSVMLNFTVNGDEPEQWIVECSADGVEPWTETFTGHSVTVVGLTVGKTYTFTLQTSDGIDLDGTNTVQYMASRLILAEDLTVTSSSGSDMTVSWKAPGDIIVENWDVRCYSENGYDEALTVSGTEALFTGIDPTAAYTVEVTAAGMTQPVRTSITANPITVTSLNVNEEDPEQLTVSWEYSGAAPSGGWLLMYSVDGSETQNVVKCSEPSAVISPRIPNARYDLVIQSADGTSIFGNVHTYITPSAEIFEGNNLSAENITAHLVKTPDKKDWTFESVGEEAYTDQFASGDPISVVLHGETDFYSPGQELSILYVIRDAYGNVLPQYTAQEEGNWRDIWYDGDYHYGELDLPAEAIPAEAGDYSVSIYFDGAAITVITFTVTE